MIQTSRSYLRLPGKRDLSFLEATGFTVKPDAVLFPKEKFSMAIVQMLDNQTSGIPIAAAPKGRRISKFLDSTDDLIALAQAGAKLEITEENSLFIERAVVSDGPMRSPMRFSKKALDSFVSAAAEGRMRSLGHNPVKYQRASASDWIGRTIDARVEKRTQMGIEANWVITTEYIPRVDSNLEVIEKLEAGLMPFDSITFSGGKWNYDEEEELMVISPSTTQPLELHEVSFVSLGRVVGAGQMSVEDADPTPGEEDSGSASQKKVYYAHSPSSAGSTRDVST